MGTYVPYPRPGEELPGRVLVRKPVSTTNNQSATTTSAYEWHCTKFKDALVELKRSTNESRVLFIEGSEKRKSRSKLIGEDRIELTDTDTEVFRLFSRTSECREYMQNALGFPDYVFDDAWNASNGFAGLSQLPTSQPAYISWFRILVKAIGTSKKTWEQRRYYWYEMTYLVHQTQGQDHFTAVCFDVPEDANDGMEISKKSKEIDFVVQLLSILNNFERQTPNSKPDWRYIQSKLLRLSVVVADRGVWACSDAVRVIEKSRHILAFDFPQAHDLLRHTQHSTEVLGVAAKTIGMWIEQFKSDQKWQQKLHGKTQNNSQSIPGQLATTLPTSSQTTSSSPNSQATVPVLTNPANPVTDNEDSPLGKETHYADLVASLQLLDNLTQRSASNDARLRNEINLAFNQVNQRDAAAMRTVSVITLLFLPATFVSTLFSMTFFNFQRESEQGWGVSRWVWLYPAIAVPLTIFAVVLWYGKSILKVLSKIFRISFDKEKDD